MVKKSGKMIPRLIIGIGLIILGLAAFKAITNDGGTDEYSVVPTMVNFPAPDLTLNNLDGEQVTISDYNQQVVLVNNWATWCPPCRAEMPTLLRYYNEHREQGFMLMAVEAGDPPDEVANFVKENDLTFPILLDPDNRSLIAFNNKNLPNSYVIDQTGYVVLTWTGPISKAMLEKYVTPLLEN